MRLAESVETIWIRGLIQIGVVPRLPVHGDPNAVFVPIHAPDVESGRPTPDRETKRSTCGVWDAVRPTPAQIRFASSVPL
jgi:hypothetical protein